MSAASTPTARSLKLLRVEGWAATKVEQRVPIPGGRPVTRDAFGIGDILAAKAGQGILLVQATSKPNMRARMHKASDAAHPDTDRHPNAPNPLRVNLVTWLRAGGKFEVWGWYSHDRRWHCRRAVALVTEIGEVNWTILE